MLYDQAVYEEYMEVFDALPIASIVNGLYLSMHGGISEKLTSINAINKIERKMEPPEETLLADLLWADPVSDRKASNTDFLENDHRGISVMFGRKPLKELLRKEKLKAIVRAHEMKLEGFKFHCWDGPEAFPPCVTIFSAPAYCNSDNDAAVMISEGDDVDIRTFSER